MALKDIWKLAVSIVLCELAGIIGSIFTFSAISTWYVGLIKPALNPPSWIFGPVWTTLYALMGISAFLVWRQGLERKDVKDALKIFGAQLALNASWSIMFFGLHSPSLAFVNIVLLWAMIVWTMSVFNTISKPAMYLLVPYLAWVSFASYLNYALWVLN